MRTRDENGFVMRLKFAALLFLLPFLPGCQSVSPSDEGGTTLFGGFDVDPGPAFQQDDKPVTKHQQYMGAGFQNQ
tara:strand:+ start:2317 stop:2541 length:225 start_codon:yes stop_codon:yes gene_type:complete